MRRWPSGTVTQLHCEKKFDAMGLGIMFRMLDTVDHRRVPIVRVS